jgi:hypothetical protein
VCAWEWFPERRGLVTGITLCSIGFGQAIFSSITTAIVNPSNDPKTIFIPGRETAVYYEKEVADRVPRMFETCLLIQMVVGIIGSIMVSRNTT